MGGSSYDRDVYSSSSSSNWGSSSASSAKLSSTTINAKMVAKKKVLKSESKCPIIIVLDVTGSNINFARLLYDKLPMLYGQIEQKKYLDDFELSICAVGDAYSDDFPIQIGDFAKGKDIDPIIEKMVLEGNGGGQNKESYELMAYYLLKGTEFIHKDAKPIVFFIGDEAMYENVNDGQVENVLAMKYESITSGSVFADLRLKFNDNVFMFLNKYGGDNFQSKITDSWTSRLAPEHVIKINEEKAIVDLMLGVISMLSNARDLNSYAVDMLDRGQTTARITSVKSSLSSLERSIVPVVNLNVLAIQKKGKGTKPVSKSKRI